LTQIEEAGLVTSILHEHLGIDIAPGENTISCVYPDHADDNPSFCINGDSSLFECKGCGKKGNLITLLKDIKAMESAEIRDLFAAVLESEDIDISDYKPTAKAKTKKLPDTKPEEVERYAAYLWKEQFSDCLEWLHARGLKDDILSRYTIGAKATTRGHAVVIPVFSDEKLVAVKKRYLQVGPGENKFDSDGSVKNLLNGEMLTDKEFKRGAIYLCEGELDALLLAQNLNNPLCLSSLGGVTVWDVEWNKKFDNRHVVILYDSDSEGRKGAETVYKQLAPYAEAVKIVDLFPENDGTDKSQKDVTDYFQAHSVEDFRALLKATPARKKVPEPVEANYTLGAITPELAMSGSVVMTRDGRVVPMVEYENYYNTDTGNAERFVATFPDTFKYNHDSHKWLMWNGKYLQECSRGEEDKAVKEMARLMIIRVSQIEDDYKRKTFLKEALKCEEEFERRNCLASAQSITEVAVTYEDLDTDPYLINLENGVYDLTKNVLVPHEQMRGKLLTKVAPCSYIPGAKCPKWIAFLNLIFPNKKNLIGFLQRFLGHAMCGVGADRIVVLGYGKGANGKTTIAEVMKMVQGVYAQHVPSDMFLTKYGKQGATPEIAKLKGARFVVATEMPEGRRLDENFLKTVTGSDTIAARRLYEEGFEFRPTHTLMIMTNHLPVVKGHDKGLWDRVRILPFDVSIPQEMQKSSNLVLAEFKEELSGILNWVLDGWKAYQAGGFQAPEEVMIASQKYRENMDHVQDFLAECTLPDGEYEHSSLYFTYAIWCDANGERKNKLTKKELREHMKRLGYVLDDDNHKPQTWIGIQQVRNLELLTPVRK